jgi:hypothetical protein
MVTSPMPDHRPAQSHRFVIVWRLEPREIEGAAEVWRGWVERIPDARQREERGERQDRVGLSRLEDLPEQIAKLIARTGPSARDEHPASPSRSSRS